MNKDEYSDLPAIKQGKCEGLSGTCFYIGRLSKDQAFAEYIDQSETYTPIYLCPECLRWQVNSLVAIGRQRLEYKGSVR